MTAHAFGGDAVGRLPDGRAVFVPLGLPGEKVRIALDQEKEHFARGHILDMLQPSEERISPRCRHFGLCGGCHYQHIAYEQQLTVKTEILRDQLRRIGHMEDARVAPAIGNDQPWAYRNHMQFHVTAEGKLGLVAAGDADSARALFAIEECRLPNEEISRLWPKLKLERGTGIKKVGIRGSSEGAMLFVLDSDSRELPQLETEARISVVHICAGDMVVQVGTDHIIMEILERTFRVSATAFFQANSYMAGRMVQHVLEHLPRACGTLIDAYCGVGLFSAFLAPRCGRLIGIESSPAACADFAANLDEFHNVELYEDAVADVLPNLDLTADAIVLDPPRAGLDRRALDAILRLDIPMLIYVSCDPATLARDAARLVQGGYQVESITPFDMFPQTYHIESISIFTRSSANEPIRR